MRKGKVCVVTGARSEYGLMRWVMEEIRSSSKLELQVAVTGSHLLPEFGETWRAIEADGLPIHEKIYAPLDTTRPAALASTVGEWTKGFADAFERLAPDCVLVMGDRYELLSVSAAATVMGIPLAHVSGGELTHGAVDDQIRHAVTKLSHLHFAANKVYTARLLQMGEEPWRVFATGEPGLDNARRLALPSREELSKGLDGFDLSRPSVLVAFHSTTQELADLDRQVAELSAALEASGLPIVFTYPNADAGAEKIVAAWKGFVARRPDCRLFQSLGQRRYLGMLRHASMIAGNSSSGLVEAPTFALPAVNIGSRQGGRMRGPNVIDCGHGRAEILSAVRKALKFDRAAPCENPYGDGRSSERVREALESVLGGRSRADILRKGFTDLPGAGPRPARIGGDFAIDAAALSLPRRPLAATLTLGKNSALPASGRAALRLCLDDARLRGKTVLLPDFLCADAILPAVKAAGARPAFYPISEDLRPDMPRLLELSKKAAAVLFIDYFGFGESEERVKALRKANPKAVLISDWVQSLHLLKAITPARQTADYAFTSLRKFLPVPDGAAVRARRPLKAGLKPAPPEAGLAAFGAGTLKHEFLEGRTPPEAEAAYVRLFASARRELSTKLEAASPVSMALAEALPLEQFAATRRANYAALAQALSGAAVRPLRPILSAQAVPLCLPVAVPDGRRDALRAFLRERGIFAPIHWALPAALGKGAAGRLSRSLLSLPVDQRCGAAETTLVARAVSDFERSLR